MYSKRSCNEVVSGPLTPSGLAVRAVVVNLGRFGSLDTCVGNTPQTLPSLISPLPHF